MIKRINKIKKFSHKTLFEILKKKENKKRKRKDKKKNDLTKKKLIRCKEYQFHKKQILLFL
jgi:hypothetical protein